MSEFCATCLKEIYIAKTKILYEKSRFDQ